MAELTDIVPELAAILASAVKNRASDVHVKVGMPAALRIDGSLRPLQLPRLSEGEVEAYLASLSAAAGLPGLPTSRTELDFSLHLAGTGRFRCHLFRQRGSWAGLVRVVPEVIPTFEELRLPAIVKTVVGLDRGIVLVCGATGMGKSTTVASILAEMARTRSVHILTIEDPIEFHIPDERSSVSQRSVGSDVAGWDEALEASFREDPDVLFIGELRSSRAVEVALQAGESGHLCFSTIHTADAVATIARIAAMVPEEQSRTVLGRLAEALKVVICQRLVPMGKRVGRILVSEVMATTPSIRDAIRDPAKHKSLVSLIVRESGGSHCQTFDQHLVVLVRNELITLETAKSAASSAAELVRMLRIS